MPSYLLPISIPANGSPKPQFETDEDRTHYLVRIPVHERSDWLVDGETDPVVGPSRDPVEGLSKARVEAPVNGQVIGQVGTKKAPSRCFT
jgi:hypothetical protein